MLNILKYLSYKCLLDKDIVNLTLYLLDYINSKEDLEEIKDNCDILIDLLTYTKKFNNDFN